MTTILKVAIVGCGHVANYHLAGWTEIARRAQVIAVCDVDEKAAKNVVERWNIPRYYTEFSEVLERENISVVDICTPPQTHKPLAIQAMESGCHVLLEKPMTMTSKEAEDIVRSQKRNGVKLGVVHNWLFEPAMLRARSVVKSGRLGDIIGIHVESLSTKDDSMAAIKQHWCHKLPGGRFGEMLAHPIYTLQHFIGRLDIENISTAKIGDYPWMSCDELQATFRSGNKLGTVYASFNSPREAILVTIYGKKSILRVDIFAQTITELPRIATNKFAISFDVLRQASQLLASTVKNVSKMIFHRSMHGHEVYIRSFVNSLIENKRLPVTVEDAYEVVKVLEEVCKRICMHG